MATSERNQLLLLICGYIRQELKDNQYVIFSPLLLESAIMQCFISRFIWSDRYIDIPLDLVQLMSDLYPIIAFRFGLHDDTIFCVSERGYMVKAIHDSNNQEPPPNRTLTETCAGFIIYADLDKYDDQGLNSGVHLWSIKSLLPKVYENGKEIKNPRRFDPRCYRSIGVTTQKKEIDVWQYH